MVDLILYVSACSTLSARAVANVKSILARYKARQVSLTVCDITAEPEIAERDQIAFTPTLCKRTPEPPVWIVGDCSNPDPLVNLLEFHGVSSTHAHRQTHQRRSRI